MGVNCLILGGDCDHGNVVKYAGPYRIASQLRKSGYTVQVVELDRSSLYSAYAAKVINKFVDKDTLWVGISSTYLRDIFGFKVTEDKEVARRIFEKDPDCDKELRRMVEHIRSKNPNIKLITGGIRAFDLSHLGFYKIAGHVDQAIVDFTDKCAANIPIEEKTIRIKEYADFVNCDIDYTTQDVFNDEKTLTVETSRGCIFKCKFCAFALTGKQKFDYIKNYDVLKEELIRNYERFGITHYNFADDTYNDSVYKLEGIYNNVISKLPFQLTFTTYLRLDLLMRFPEMQDILVASGLVEAVYGIETLDADNAKIIGKGVDPQKQIEFLARIKQDKFKNINATSGFIVGLPYDTTKSLEKLPDWFDSINNPLDNWVPGTLGLRGPMENADVYRSDFENNSEKYGYVIEYGDDGSVNWHNTMSGLKSSEAHEVTTEIYKRMRTHPRRKYSGFMSSVFLNIGIEEKIVREKPAVEIQKMYDIPQLIRNKQISYYKNLMKL